MHNAQFILSPNLKMPDEHDSTNRPAVSLSNATLAWNFCTVNSPICLPIATPTSVEVR